MKHTLLLLIVVVLANGGQKNTPHDGHWWLAISMGEQKEYRWGYLDCYVDSLKLKSPSYIEDREAGQLITDSYRSGKARINEIVPRVMKGTWAARAGKSAPYQPQGGEAWTEPHGFFDGLYWKGGSDAEKLAFVEGETDCFNLEAASRVRFPLPASDYAKWLDEAYGLVQGSSVPRSSEDAKIADVLLLKGERASR
jgi:hypothetical protein